MGKASFGLIGRLAAIVALVGLALCPPVAVGSAATAAATGPEAGAGFLLTSSGVAWATVGDSIVRSTDWGVQWERVFPAHPSSTQQVSFGPAFFMGPEQAWVLEEDEQSGGTAQVTSVWHSSDGGRTWSDSSALPGYPAPVNLLLFDQVVFSGPQDGWVLGYGTNFSSGTTNLLSGEIWRTTDGGHTWAQLPGHHLPDQGLGLGATSSCGSGQSFDMSWNGSTSGWITAQDCAGSAPGIWHSDDGGLDWDRVTLPPPPGGWPEQGSAQADAPQFFGPSTALLAINLAGGEVLVYRSENRGASWALDSRLRTGSLRDTPGFQAVNSQTWVLPAPAGLYETSDGGQSWGLNRSGLSLDQVSTASFVSAEVGLVGSVGAPEPGVALRTVDGGRSWTVVGTAVASSGQIPSPGTTLIDFTSSSTGYAAGSGGILATTDAGVLWRRLTPALEVNELDFVDSAVGWALGANELLRTTDGGVRWSAMTEPSPGALSSVRFFDAAQGVGAVCNGSGSSLQWTTDGGASWVPLNLPGPLAMQSGCMVSNGSGGAACFAGSGMGWAIVLLPRPGAGAAPVPTLVGTNDGGRSWHRVGSPPPPTTLLGCAGEQLWGETVAGVGMNQASYSLFVLSGAHPYWREALRHPSADGPAPTSGGLRAAEVPQAPGAEQGPFDLVNPSVAWFAGLCFACTSGRSGSPSGSAYLVGSDDAGTSWAPAASGGTGAASSTPIPYVGAGPVPLYLDFLSSATGFVLGSPASQSVATTLAMTTDGGSSWRVVHSFPTNG